MRDRRPRAVPRRGLGAWTIQRATVFGLAAGLGALLVSALVGHWLGPLLYVYAALLAFTGFCGLSVLWITFQDMKTRGRGGRMHVIRAFDIAAGLLLAGPSLYALKLVWPELN
jgi:hypothetical protein